MNTGLLLAANTSSSTAPGSRSAMAEVLRRVPWIRIAAIGLLLLIPAQLNVTFGGSLDMWWAPFPMWILLVSAIGIQPRFSVIIPTAVFFALAAGIAGGRRFRTAAFLLLALSSLIHGGWMVGLFREGVERHGVGHTALAFGLGTAILTLSVWQAFLARRRHDDRHLMWCAWSVMLWWAWMAMPWLGEAI